MMTQELPPINFRFDASTKRSKRRVVDDVVIVALVSLVVCFAYLLPFATICLLSLYTSLCKSCDQNQARSGEF